MRKKVLLLVKPAVYGSPNGPRLLGNNALKTTLSSCSTEPGFSLGSGSELDTGVDIRCLIPCTAVGTDTGLRAQATQLASVSLLSPLL